MTHQRNSNASGWYPARKVSRLTQAHQQNSLPSKYAVASGRGVVFYKSGGGQTSVTKLASSTSELATSWDANQFTGNRIDSVFQSSSVPDCVRCYAHLGALAPGRDLYIHGGDADDSRGHCACHILKPACCRTAAPKGVWQLAGWFS
jgi:hypothetical protein